MGAFRLLSRYENGLHGLWVADDRSHGDNERQGGRPMAWVQRGPNQYYYDWEHIDGRRVYTYFGGALLARRRPPSSRPGASSTSTSFGPGRPPGGSSRRPSRSPEGSTESASGSQRPHWPPWVFTVPTTRHGGGNVCDESVFEPDPIKTPIPSVPDPAAERPGSPVRARRPRRRTPWRRIPPKRSRP